MEITRAYKAYHPSIVPLWLKWSQGALTSETARGSDLETNDLDPQEEVTSHYELLGGDDQNIIDTKLNHSTFEQWQQFKEVPLAVEKDVVKEKMIG